MLSHVRDELRKVLRLRLDATFFLIARHHIVVAIEDCLERIFLFLHLLEPLLKFVIIIKSVVVFPAAVFLFDRGLDRRRLSRSLLLLRCRLLGTLFGVCSFFLGAQLLLLFRRRREVRRILRFITLDGFLRSDSFRGLVLGRRARREEWLDRGRRGQALV